MINSSIFSEDSISSEEIFLNCTLGIDIHEIDIDIDNVTGKWVPYTSIIFTENSSDPQYRLSVDKNWTNVLFGKKPYDFIEIDLLTLKATSAILSGMEGDSIGGGMGSDDLGGSMEGDGLFGGMEGDSIGGGMGSDGLGGSMDGDGLVGGIREGFCEIVPSRKNNS